MPEEFTYIYGNEAFFLELHKAKFEDARINKPVHTIITSPPYWNQKEYSYWPSYEDYLKDVYRWVLKCYFLLEPGRHCFWVIPDKIPYPPKENGTDERLYLPIYSDTERIAANCGFVCKYPIVWIKPHGTQKMFGSYPYPPTTIHTPFTERICVWRKPGKYKPRADKEKSKYTKGTWVQYARDAWNIHTVSDPHHPAVFPIEIPARILLLWTFQGDNILDPFAGSGTTLRAAYIHKRNAIAVEPNYYDLLKSRTEKLCAQIRFDL